MVFFGMGIMFVSCTYKSKINVSNISTCTTTGITYTNFVQGYLSNNGCASSGCHGGQQPPLLLTYNDVKVAAAQANFMGSIKHSSGFSPMPKYSSKTDSCTIAKLDAWIAANMPN
jgi:hypothetical protein